MCPVKKMIQKHGFVLLIILISGVAFLLRAISCFWGYPECLHPDEAVIVESAMDMLSRHSWEAYCYFRPDQIEIKCDAILFTLFSWIRYHKPAYEAFHDHQFVFYLVARFLTTFFGTAMIPLAVAFLGRLLTEENKLIKRTSQIMTALILAGSAIFVEHSAYATPDIVLSFFSLMFAWFCLRYLEDGNRFDICACAVMIGFGVATKYPAAIMCIPLAVLVIYRSIRIEKKPKMILQHGITSVAIVIFTVFVIAPNLFTDYQTVYRYFMNETDGNYAGTTDLGFWGNLFFYLKMFCKDIGAVSALFFIAGVVYCFVRRNARLLVMLVGLSYWVCLSALKLHVLRWGIPQYVFYVIMVSIGSGYLFRIIQEKTGHRKYRKFYTVMLGAVVGFFVINAMIGGLCHAKFTMIPDTRLTVEEVLMEHGIERENAIYTHHTPFALTDGLGAGVFFDHSGDYVNVAPFFAPKKYYVTSDYLKESLLMDGEKFKDQLDLIKLIEKKYQRINLGQEEPDGNYETRASILSNLYYSVRYLFSDLHSSGWSIRVYDLSPGTAALKNLESGKYLNYESDDNGIITVTLSETPSPWIMYENADRTVTLINADYRDEDYLRNALIPGNTGLIVWADDLMPVSAEEQRLPGKQWTLRAVKSGYTLTNTDGKALSVHEEVACLESIGESDYQIWDIEELPTEE